MVIGEGGRAGDVFATPSVAPVARMSERRLPPSSARHAIVLRAMPGSARCYYARAQRHTSV